MLVELACFPEHILTTEVERRFGKGSAVRVSEWNGANLETSGGAAFAKQRVCQLRPAHTTFEKRTEEQRIKLEQAKKQYAGAIEMGEVAWSVGTEVDWELSQRCEA